jgi:predicted nucleic acid-binding protein
MPGALVDTNILVYAYQAAGNDPRSKAAKEILEEFVLAGGGFVGVQNLSEFSSVCLTKVHPPLSPGDVRGVVVDLEQGLTVLAPTAGTVKAALGAVEKHSLSFWDAMIWAVAKENGLDEVLSEDFQEGREIEGVRFRNPLKP